MMIKQGNKNIIHVRYGMMANQMYQAIRKKKLDTRKEERAFRSVVKTFDVET